MQFMEAFEIKKIIRTKKISNDLILYVLSKIFENWYLNKEI